MLLAPTLVQAQASSPNIHVVQDGETLLQIALDAHTDVSTIAALNNLGDSNVLSVGQSLKLPAPSASASTSSAPAAPTATSRPQNSGSYTIAEGDTLWDIAQRFGTTPDAIVQLNHLDDSDHLKLGAALSLPAGAASTPRAAAPSASPAPTPAGTVASAAAPAPAAATAGPGSGSKRNLLVSYTVQPGETLTQIAQQFDVRADTIIQATNLDDPNRIGVGSVLKVPVAAREHVVADGETLRDIAANEKVDLGSLIDFNQMNDPELIRVGQTVLLPVAANPQVASETTTSSVAAAAAPATPTSAASATASAQPTPSATAAASAQPTASASPSASAQPTPSPTPSTAATPATPATPPATATTAAKPTAAATPAAKPAAPVAVVAAPPGSPTDGLAGAGLKLLGSAYVWGGSSPSGFDCSGFVWYVARQVGKSISRGMFAQYNAGSHPTRDQLQVGDLVFFQNTFSPGLSHNGIYIGNNQFVHAADEAAGVTISSLNTGYWKSHWFGATRLP